MTNATTNWISALMEIEAKRMERKMAEASRKAAEVIDVRRKENAGETVKISDHSNIITLEART
jgi:hypothetical protein